MRGILVYFHSGLRNHEVQSIESCKHKLCASPLKELRCHGTYPLSVVQRSLFLHENLPVDGEHPFGAELLRELDARLVYDSSSYGCEIRVRQVTHVCRIRLRHQRYVE